ncbi:MAG: PilZ domain-containing protein [Gammaproteobacteria bacterium]
MPRLTLSFKDKRLKIYPLLEDELLVGRDPACGVHIDSLAVEPVHARIHRLGADYHLVPAEGVTGVVVNHNPISGDCQLHDGDLIQIGKHTLTFAQEAPVDDTSASVGNNRPLVTGWMQIMSGSHLGRTIRLDRAMTRLGKSESQTAMVVRRNDGYYLSHLQGEDSPLVNDQSIGERTHRLGNGETVRIGDLELHFFLEEANPVPAKAPQRRFSRVPFDASATLSDADHQWDTEVMDLSLKGALIRRPADWSGFTGNHYRLRLQLDEDVEIDMDVTVAHVEEDRVGLTCRDIDVDSVTHLRRLVELNLGSADLLERELAALG